MIRKLLMLALLALSCSVLLAGPPAGVMLPSPVATATVSVVPAPSPVWGEVSTAISGFLALVLAWFAKVVAGAIRDLAAQLAEKVGLKVSEDRQAAFEVFVEQQIRAAEEKYAGDKIVEAGVAGAAKLKAVTDAVRHRFPNVSAAEIDSTIHATIQRLPGFGATS